MNSVQAVIYVANAQSEQPSPLHAVIAVKSRTMKDHEPWSEGQEGE